MHGRTYPLSTAAKYLLNAHKTCFQRAEGLQYSISQSSTCLKSSVTQAALLTASVRYSEIQSASHTAVSQTSACPISPQKVSNRGAVGNDELKTNTQPCATATPFPLSLFLPPSLAHWFTRTPIFSLHTRLLSISKDDCSCSLFIMKHLFPSFCVFLFFVSSGFALQQ